MDTNMHINTNRPDLGGPITAAFDRAYVGLRRWWLARWADKIDRQTGYALLAWRAAIEADHAAQGGWMRDAAALEGLSMILGEMSHTGTPAEAVELLRHYERRYLAEGGEHGAA